MAQNQYLSYADIYARVGIVLAVIFLGFFIATSFGTFEESKIRRQTYISNLEQQYRSEINDCLNVLNGQSEELTADQARTNQTSCINRINDERTATLLDEWGHRDLLLTPPAAPAANDAAEPAADAPASEPAQ